MADREPHEERGVAEASPGTPRTVDWLIQIAFAAIGMILVVFLVCAALVQHGWVDIAQIQAVGEGFLTVVVFPVSLALVAAVVEFLIGLMGRGSVREDLHKYVLWRMIGGTDGEAEDQRLGELQPIETIRQDEGVFDINLGVELSSQTFAIVGMELVVVAIGIDLAPCVGPVQGNAILPLPLMLVTHGILLVVVLASLVFRDLRSPHDEKTRDLCCAFAIALGFISAAFAFFSQFPGG